MLSAQRLLVLGAIPIAILLTVSQYSLLEATLTAITPLLALFLSSAPTVALPQGTYRGVVLQESFPQPVEAFLGVPYALPPVGDLRFRPAEPLPQSNKTSAAESYGYM
jgi:hypothetical protein